MPAQAPSRARAPAPARAPRPADEPDDAPRSSPLAYGALAGIAGFHLARATPTTLDAFERHIGQPYELSKVEFSLLMLVSSNPGIVPKRLARALAVAPPKLSLLVDRMQQRGLIQRERNAADGRSQHLRLTDRGRKLARDAAQAAGPMEGELLTRLTRAEHAMLLELLEKLAVRA